MQIKLQMRPSEKYIELKNPKFFQIKYLKIVTQSSFRLLASKTYKQRCLDKNEKYKFTENALTVDCTQWTVPGPTQTTSPAFCVNRKTGTLCCHKCSNGGHQEPRK